MANQTYLSILFVFLSWVVSPLWTTASAEETKDYSAMSLSELLNLELVVETASRSEESVVTAPGTITRLDMTKLRQMGVNSLTEALSYVPGVQVIDGGLGNSLVMIRGITEVFNQKVLFMLDGVPYYMSSHSDFPLYSIPIDSIEAVEVIRGAASLLHGSNAATGAINIILKDKKHPLTVRAGGGSNDTMTITADGTLDLNKDWSLRAGTEVRKITGMKLEYPRTRVHGHFTNDPVTGDDISNQVFIDPADMPDNASWDGDDGDYIPIPTSGQLTRSEESYSGLLQLAGPNFEATFSAFTQSRTGLGSVLALYMPMDATYRGGLASLHYRFDLDDWSISTYADHTIVFIDFFITNNNHTKDADGRAAIGDDPDHLFAQMDSGWQSFEDPWMNNTRSRIGTLIRSQFDRESAMPQLTLGADFEMRRTGQYILYDATKDTEFLEAQPKGSVTEANAFVQARKELLGKLILVGGVRLVNNSLGGTHLVPMASSMYKFTPNSTLELGYSAGYNSPNLHQLYAYLPNVKGNKDLIPETSEVFELGYVHSGEHFLIGTCVYHLQISDLLVREKQPGSTVSKNTNAEGTITRFGAELDVQLFFSDVVTNMNLAYHHQGNAHFEEDVTAKVQPLLDASFTALWKPITDFSLGATARILSPRFSTFEADSETPERLPTQVVINLSGAYTFNSFTLMLQVENILDQRQENPDFILRIPSLNNGPSRSIYASLQYSL